MAAVMCYFAFINWPYSI